MIRMSVPDQRAGTGNELLISDVPPHPPLRPQSFPVVLHLGSVPNWHPARTRGSGGERPPDVGRGGWPVRMCKVGAQVALAVSGDGARLLSGLSTIARVTRGMAPGGVRNVGALLSAVSLGEVWRSVRSRV